MPSLLAPSGGVHVSPSKNSGKLDVAMSSVSWPRATQYDALTQSIATSSDASGVPAVGALVAVHDPPDHVSIRPRVCVKSLPYCPTATQKPDVGQDTSVSLEAVLASTPPGSGAAAPVHVPSTNLSNSP